MELTIGYSIASSTINLLHLTLNSCYRVVYNRVTKKRNAVFSKEEEDSIIVKKYVN